MWNVVQINRFSAILEPTDFAYLMGLHPHLPATGEIHPQAMKSPSPSCPPTLSDTETCAWPLRRHHPDCEPPLQSSSPLDPPCPPPLLGVPHHPRSHAGGTSSAFQAPVKAPQNKPGVCHCCSVVIPFALISLASLEVTLAMKQHWETRPHVPILHRVRNKCRAALSSFTVSFYLMKSLPPR